MTTAPSKILRVLSGVHAGADIALAPGRYSLGAPAAAALASEGAASDAGGAPQRIGLLDWRGGDCSLAIDAGDGSCRIASLAPPGDAPTVWNEFEPARLGGLLLCVGDSALAWPDDATLLARAGSQHAPAPGGGVGRGLRERAGYALTGLGIGLLFTASTLFAGGERPPSRPLAPTTAQALQQLRTALQARGLAELAVESGHSGVAVTGFVRDAAEDALARTIVAAHAAPRAEIAWEVASDVAAQIDAALRAPEVKTRYLGAGRFVAEGRAASVEGVEAVATQLRRDLGPQLRGLELAVRPLRHASPYAATMVADVLLYQERPDGTKRFGTAGRP